MDVVRHDHRGDQGIELGIAEFEVIQDQLDFCLIELALPKPKGYKIGGALQSPVGEVSLFDHEIFHSSRPR